MNENPAASDWAAARGEKWRAQIAGMEAMIEPVNGPLIGALHLDARCRIADVGCGGGQTTLEILRHAPTGSVVHGYDISAALIELARARISSEKRAIAFKVADMATATAPQEPYDRLASRFAVMFFADPSTAFANLFRWLAPGGRFACGLGLTGRKSVDDHRTQRGRRNHRSAAARSRRSGAVPLFRRRQVDRAA
jgi:SAM-dependent methyltransferase